MDKTTSNAQYMYNENSFGEFSYGSKREKHDLLLKQIIEKINGDEKLYDIGCGAGFWIDFYCRHGIKKENINCLDLAPDNIEKIKKQGISAVCCDAVSLPFEDNVADITVSNGVLMCVSDPDKGFSELVRITKKTGTIYCNVYSYWHIYNIVYKITYPIRFFYWNISKKILDVFYFLVNPFMQIFAYIAFKEFMDKKTAMTIFMDTFITPRLKFFSKRDVLKLCRKNNAKVMQFKSNRWGLMLAAVIKREDV